MDIGKTSPLPPSPASTAGPAPGWAGSAGNASSSSMVAAYSFDWRTAFKDELDAQERIAITNRYEPMDRADTALETIDKQLAKVQKVINLTRPDIKANDWDFTVKGGQIEVTGGLGADDKKWIERMLKANDKIASAATSYVAASVAYLETSEDNPVYASQNRSTGKIVFYDFKNVEQHFGDVFQFKSVMTVARELYRNTCTGEAGDPGPNMGMDSLEILASRFNPKAASFR